VEWLKEGIPLEEVSKLLGHASIRTTEKHYAPWVKSRQDRLDDLVMATWESGSAAPAPCRTRYSQAEGSRAPNLPVNSCSAERKMPSSRYRH
jgi:hypothetical protein